MEMDDGGFRLEFRLQAAPHPAKPGIPNLSPYKDRSAVTRPSTVGWMHNKQNFPEVHPGAGQIAPGELFLGFAANQNAHEFTR